MIVADCFSCFGRSCPKIFQKHIYFIFLFLQMRRPLLLSRQRRSLYYQIKHSFTETATKERSGGNVTGRAFFYFNSSVFLQLQRCGLFFFVFFVCLFFFWFFFEKFRPMETRLEEIKVKSKVIWWR